jgi:hypothetical protein
MKNERKHYTAAEKVAILRRHLLDKVPVADLCEEKNEHNGWVPRDFWLEKWEAIIDFHLQHPLEGYRRLTFMMLDADVVAVSPASVWRVLKHSWQWQQQHTPKR